MPGQTADYRQALQLWDVGRRSEAIEVARRFRAANPHDWRSAELLGVFLTNEGQPREARDLLREAAAGNPDHATTQRALAHANLSLGDLAEARPAADRAMTLAPDNPGGYLILASIEEADTSEASARRRKAGVEKVRSLVDQALRLAPTDAGVHLAAARLVVAIGDRPRAAAIARAGLQQDPTNADLQTLEATLVDGPDAAGRALSGLRQVLGGSPLHSRAGSAMRARLYGLSQRREVLGFLVLAALTLVLRMTWSAPGDPLLVARVNLGALLVVVVTAIAVWRRVRRVLREVPEPMRASVWRGRGGRTRWWCTTLAWGATAVAALAVVAVPVVSAISSGSQGAEQVVDAGQAMQAVQAVALVAIGVAALAHTVSGAVWAWGGFAFAWPNRRESHLTVDDVRMMRNYETVRALVRLALAGLLALLGFAVTNAGAGSPTFVVWLLLVGSWLLQSSLVLPVRYLVLGREVRSDDDASASRLSLGGRLVDLWWVASCLLFVTLGVLVLIVPAFLAAAEYLW